MKTRIVHTEIWDNDDWFASLNKEEAILFLYLFTNSVIGQSGIFELSQTKLNRDLIGKLTTAEIETAKKRLLADKKAFFFGSWVYVVNARKRGGYEGSQNSKALLDELYRLPDNIFQYFINGVSIPYQYTSDTTINNKSQIINLRSKILDRKSKDLRESNVKREIIKSIILVVFLFTSSFFLTKPTQAKKIEVEYSVSIRGYKSPQAQASGKKTVGGVPPSSNPVSKKTTVPHGSQIEELIKSYFGSEADVAIAVARAESGLRPDAVGDGAIAYWQDGVEYGKSYGVFQIRHLPGRPDPQILLDPVENVRYAYSLYKRSGFSPWSAYTNGSYYKFL